MRYNNSTNKRILEVRLLEELLKQILESQKESKQDIIEMKQSLTRIEQEQGRKISALYDAREIQFDVNERMTETLLRIDEKINRIENKLDRLSFKVATHDTFLKQVK